jgi:hypothetical protein
MATMDTCPDAPVAGVMYPKAMTVDGVAALRESSMDTKRITARPAGTSRTAAKATTSRARVGSEVVWRALAKASFAVVSHVNAAGEPRSSGVVYGIVDRRLYVAVAGDGWKSKQIATGQEVAVTVPIRRGGVLALLAPIPPATITFHARATVHPAGTLDISTVSKELTRLVPDDRKASSCVLELAPEGSFLTYGVGVSLMDMRDPAVALAHVPVS